MDSGHAVSHQTGAHSQGEIEKSLGAIGTTGGAFGIAKTVDAAGLQLPGSLAGQQVEFVAAWTDLKMHWGTSMLPFFSLMLQSATSVLRSLDNDGILSTLFKAAKKPSQWANSIGEEWGDSLRNSIATNSRSFAGKGGGTHHTNINIDGKHVATAVVPYLANPTAPQTGLSLFDPSMGLPLPVASDRPHNALNGLGCGRDVTCSAPRQIRSVRPFRHRRPLLGAYLAKKQGAYMSRIIHLFLVALILPTVVHAQSSFGHWSTGAMTDNTGLYAATMNDSGAIMGEYCFFSSKSCAWVVDIDTGCEKDHVYPVLANSDQGAGSFDIVCSGLQPNGLYGYHFKNWQDLEKLIKSGDRIGIAMPMQAD